MRQALNRISNSFAALFSVLFRSARQQADQTKLTQHILEVNKKQSSAEIINEVALCLKDILSYRLFAFVMQREGKADIWLDPRMYKNSIEEIILKDFHIQKKEDLNYLNHSFHPGEAMEHFNMEDLVYYDIRQENDYFRLYIMSGSQQFEHHDELVNMILQGASLALSRQLKIENLKDAAVIDPLTGCYNRREFETQLKRNIAGAVRHKNNLSLFMFDLDHFKKINDTHGHLAGDRVLREVSRMVQKNMRSGDILARYGGEEFIAILPETDKVKAMELADRLRLKISRMCISHNHKQIQVTASFGVAQLEPHTDMERFIHDADTMLYRAKMNGRNTVMPGVIKVVPRETPEHREGLLQ